MGAQKTVIRLRQPQQFRLANWLKEQPATTHQQPLLEIAGRATGELGFQVTRAHVIAAAESAEVVLTPRRASGYNRKGGDRVRIVAIALEQVIVRLGVDLGDLAEPLHKIATGRATDLKGE